MMYDLTLSDQDRGTFVGALGMAWGLSAIVVGKFAQHFGIQYTLYLALGGVIVVLSVRRFLHETAPRLAHRSALGSVSALDQQPGLCQARGSGQAREPAEQWIAMDWIGRPNESWPESGRVVGGEHGGARA